MCDSNDAPTMFTCQDDFYYNCFNKKCEANIFATCCKNDPVVLLHINKTTKIPCQNEGSTLKNPYRCGMYYKCQGGTWVGENCTIGKVFDGTSEKCTANEKCQLALRDLDSEDIFADGWSDGDWVPIDDPFDPDNDTGSESTDSDTSETQTETGTETEPKPGNTTVIGGSTPGTTEEHFFPIFEVTTTSTVISSSPPDFIDQLDMFLKQSAKTLKRVQYIIDSVRDVVNIITDVLGYKEVGDQDTTLAGNGTSTFSTEETTKTTEDMSDTTRSTGSNTTKADIGSILNEIIQNVEGTTTTEGTTTRTTPNASKSTSTSRKSTEVTTTISSSLSTRKIMKTKGNANIFVKNVNKVFIEVHKD